MSHGVPIDPEEMRHARRRARLTQEALARRVRCSSTHIMRIESGRQSPSPGLLDSIIAEIGDAMLTPESAKVYSPKGMSR